MFFLWKDDKSCENHENFGLELIDSINTSLSRFASSAHKTKIRELLNLVMLDKISPGQFRVIYQKLTDDRSIFDNQKSKQ